MEQLALGKADLWNFGSDNSLEKDTVQLKVKESDLPTITPV